MIDTFDQNKGFKAHKTFEYAGKEKKTFAYTLFAILALIAILVIVYVFSLQHIDFFLFEWINGLVTHVSDMIGGSNLLGVLYAALFGGLFFVFIPLEVIVGKFLISSGNPFFVLVLYLTGLTLSFTLNYTLGKNLSTLAKRLISTKQFYKIKSKLNRYGGLTIFLFNLLPLPAPPLSAIVGVFRYNKKRFYTMFLAGQFLKVAVLYVGLLFIV
ncbi:MAG: VTT domain-containing protein [Nanobdellota archaeon]